MIELLYVDESGSPYTLRTGGGHSPVPATAGTGPGAKAAAWQELAEGDAAQILFPPTHDETG